MSTHFDLPWGAWFGDGPKAFSLPGNATVDVADIEARSALATEEIRSSLTTLAAALAAKQPQSAILVVDDLTRPLKMAPILAEVMAVLAEAGLGEDQVSVLIGGGGHRALTREEVAMKVGQDIVDRYPILDHSPFENLEEVPVDWKGTPVRLNRDFVQADFRIIASGLVPHSFAGFSGGAKMLFPGIADIDIIKRTHKSVLMGFMGKLGVVEGNKFRNEIEELATQVGVDYFLGLVGNGQRDVVQMYSGDLITAHREAAEYARQYYTCSVSEEPYDVVFVNAYPKDTELLQAANAFIPLKSAGRPLVKEGGTVVVMSACSEGMGHHELFGPDKLLYRKPRPLRQFRKQELLIYGENLTAQECARVFAEDYPFFENWADLSAKLAGKYPDGFRGLVFPWASLQLVGE